MSRLVLFGRQPQRDDVDSAELETALTDTPRGLRRALDTLSVADRELLLWVSVNEDVSSPNALVAFGLTSEALRARLSRARKRLGEAMWESETGAIRNRGAK